MNLHNTLTIAIDFDGTIVENAYPRIGKTRIFAFETMRKLLQDGHRLILWTYRHGDRLDEAVAFCKENGVEFYAINKSFPEEQFDDTQSRK
ncbi:MAG: hydrolase, partial [Flavobacteriaceae bacterium]|nr:hydrolase [Flavobacteriaceae bacterium]